MNFIAKVQLHPQLETHIEALEKTFERVNLACNFITKQVFDHNLSRQTHIQHATYDRVRETFDLGSQMTQRCVLQVYNRLQKGVLLPGIFNPDDPISYDERILNWKLDESAVSLWTVHGRKTIPFKCGEHQRALLRFQHGTSDLIVFEGEYYIFTMCDMPSPSPKDIEGVWV